MNFSQKKSRYVSFYLVGFGSGAHIAGAIAKRMHVPRLTALSPDGPGFRNDSDPSTRLDGSENAEIIDVWNSNMGRCLPSLGTNENNGNFIFFINGGQKQPACPDFTLKSLLSGDYFFGILGLIYPQFCDHLMAAQYYQVSINSHCCEFLAYDCDSTEACQHGRYDETCTGGDVKHYPTCNIMGYNLDRNVYTFGTNGTMKYFVNTTADCPYCIEPTGQNFDDTFARLYKFILKTKSEQNCTFNF